jgi:diguanylate cyclase (GGDEF)-like protein/PAS domain S-box-containing protein
MGDGGRTVITRPNRDRAPQIRLSSVPSSPDQLAVFDMLPGAVMVAVDRRIVYANPAAIDLFGVADLPALAEREASRAHLHADDVGFAAERQAARERGELVSSSVEYRILRPDGSVRVVEWTTLPYALGDRRAMLHAVDDVTALAGVRDALRASELRQREVVATLAEGVIVVDAHGVCRDANPSAAGLLRLDSVADLIGLPAETMPLIDEHGEPLARHEHPLWRCLDHGEQVRSEVCAVAYPHRVRRMRVSVIPMRGGDHQIAGAVVTFDDVTDQLEDQERTSRSEERFRKIAAISPVAVFETDATGSCTYVNDRWCEFSGSTFEGALGLGWTDAVHPDDLVRVAREWTRAVTHGERFKTELRYLHPDGVTTSVYCEAAPILDDAGGIAGWIGSAMDVTAELALREGLRDSEARFRLLVEHSPDVVVRINMHPWRIDYVSPSIVNLTGRIPEDFYADPGLIISFIHQDDLVLITDPSTMSSFTDEFECRVIDGSGATRVVEVRRNILTVAGVTTAVEATIRDVTLDVAEQRRLEDMAHRDELTGLPNRRALMAALDGRLAGRQLTAVIFLDLDGFKRVNDTHGHDVGDALLQAFGRRLVGLVREGDFVARLGGDEFVVVALPDHSGALADRLVGELALPYVLDGRLIVVGVSVGITNFDWTGSLQQAEDLLHQADLAMYEAKRRGKGQVVVTT